MTNVYDTIVIGAGHNGLVCATYLARAGQSVLVLEAASQVGGGAVTREFAPGFKVSACAHLLHLLQPKILKDLNLSGLDSQRRSSTLDTIALDEQGRHLTLNSDTATGSGLSPQDADAYSSFKTRMKRYAKVLSPLLTKAPPRFMNGGFEDSKTLAKLGFDLRFGLGKKSFQDFLRIAGINIFDVLEEVIENDLLKGAISFDAVLGTHMGPRSPNSVLSYLYRLTGEINGDSNCVTIPVGGMGKVSETLADAARSAGVEILTDAPVGKIILTDGCASGAKLENGTVYEARKVVSNADPKTTFLKLVGAPNLEALFAHRVNNIRMKGTAAKLHLALNGLPKFNGLDEVQTGQRLIIAPSMKYVESAYDPVKYGEYSPKPAMEITIPTIHDDGLASQGNHVLSAIVQYTPYKLKKGWEGSRQAFIDMAIDRIATFAPGIRDEILHQELLTPADIEKEFRMTGGHWHHGEFAIDQLLIMRPVYGAAQYATPVDGLYLCGAGAHPGGGIMGAAGHNAAKAVLSGRKVA